MITTDTGLVLKDVSVGYGTQKTVIRDVTLHCRAGVTAFIGRNGVGKTTLFRAIAGLLPIKAGFIGPVDMHAANHSWSVRYAPQFCPGARSLRVMDLMVYLARLDGLDGATGRVAAEKALDRVGLSDVSSVRSTELSGGMSKRLGIAQCLLVNPEVLLLDEPTSGLDPVQRREIQALISELSEGRIVLFSTHDMPEVKSLAQDFVLISRGNVGRAEDVSTVSVAELEDLLAQTPDPSRREDIS